MIDISTYRFISEYIFKHSGIKYTENDFYRLEARIITLADSLKLSNPNELVSFFNSPRVSPNDHGLLIDIATNNETYFMRDQKPFNALAKEVVSTLIEKKENHIKIWSCASSTGQEPYSILMKIAEVNGIEFLNKVTLDATDISIEALEKAKKGIYTGLDVQRGLPAKYLIKYFGQNSSGHWEINTNIRQKVNYSQFNLLTGNFPTDKYHVIFCRNVLIYQTKENKEAILIKLSKALKSDGLVIMGNGESIIGLNVPLVREQIGELMAFKRKS